MIIDFAIGLYVGVFGTLFTMGMLTVAKDREALEEREEPRDNVVEVKFRLSERLREMFPQEDFEYTAIFKEYQNVLVTWVNGYCVEEEYYTEDEVEENFENGDWVKV